MDNIVHPLIELSEYKIFHIKKKKNVIPIYYHEFVELLILNFSTQYICRYITSFDL